MENKCRSCLRLTSQELKYYSLLTVFPEFARKSLSVLDLLSTVSSSKVELLEGLPSLICSDCFKSVKSAFSFITAFKHSQKILLRKYKKNHFEQEDNNKSKEQCLDSNEEDIIIITEEDNLNPNEEQICNAPIIAVKHPEFIKIESAEPDETSSNALSSDLDDDFEYEMNDLEEEFNNLGEHHNSEEKNCNLEKFADSEEEFEYFEEQNDELEEEFNDIEEESDDLENDINMAQDDLEEEDNNSVKSEEEENNAVFDAEADQEIIQMEETIILQATPKKEHSTAKGQTPKIFSCEFCEKSYTAHRNLLAHIRRKHPERAVEHRARLKGSKENLKKLGQKVEKESHVYKCDICDKIYLTKGYLNDHKNNFHHPDWQRVYKCDACNENFKSRNAINYHNLAVHIGKKFTCHICSKKFITPSTLRQHIVNVHEGKAPEKYLCSICGRGFKYNTALKYHMGKMHTHKRDFICGYCGATFILLGELRCHERNHSGERPFSCQHCKKTFKRSAEKQKHERTHLGIYPYHCEYCVGSRVFISSYNMKIHWLQHRGQYDCEVCDKNFASQEILKFHYSHKHKIKDVVIEYQE